MKQITSTIQFSKEYPSAFQALPEPYQNDNCLEFLVENIAGEEIITCFPASGQEAVLGEWVCFFSQENQVWLQ